MTPLSRQTASRLLDSTTDIASFATGWAAGTGVDRALPRTVPGRLALVLGGALVGAIAADELLYVVTGPLRDRLRVPAPASADTMTAPSTLADACAVLAADTAADAAYRAASRTYTLDRSGGLVTQAQLWHGYSDGNAALFLAPGAVLFCRHTDSLADYELAQAHSPEPVKITSLAQLTHLLPIHTDKTDDPDDVLEVEVQELTEEAAR